MMLSVVQIQTGVRSEVFPQGIPSDPKMKAHRIISVKCVYYVVRFRRRGRGMKCPNSLWLSITFLANFVRLCAVFLPSKKAQDAFFFSLRRERRNGRKLIKRPPLPPPHLGRPQINWISSPAAVFFTFSLFAKPYRIYCASES